MFTKAKLLYNSKQDLLPIEKFISIVEKFYAPSQKLECKLTPEHFNDFLKKNPLLLKVNQEIEARN